MTLRSRGRGALALAATAILIHVSGCSGCSDEERGAGGGIATGDVPRIEVSPYETTLPSVAVGGETFGDFVIANIGGETLTLGAATIESDSTEFEVGLPTATVLEPGDEASVRVTYRPTDAGADEAIFHVDSDALNKEEGRALIHTQLLAGGLFADPPALEFGSVPSGEAKVLSTDIVNGGGAALELTYIGLSEDSATDFRVTGIRKASGEAPADDAFEEVRGTIALGPQDRVRISVEYAPRGGNDDVGSILIHTTDEGTPTFTVPLGASEPSPALALSPTSIDFGPTPAEGATRTFKIRSVGNSPLTVASVGQAFPPHAAFALENLPEPGAAFANGFEHEVSVHFTPPVSDDQQFTLIQVQTNDPTQPNAVVEVLGRLDAPVIRVVPDMVHFGGPAAGHEVRREITISNVGTKPLTVTGVGMNAAVSHADFGVRTDLAFPVVVEAGGAEVVEATFTPSPEDGQREGLIVVESDDPFRPSVSVILRGLNGGAERCDVIAVENQKDFGLVGYGREKILPIRFIGTGTVDCDIVGIELEAGLAGLPVGESFRIVRNPDPMRIPPALETAVEVGFTPEDGGFFGMDFLPKTADLLLTFSGPNATGGPEQRELKVRLSGTGGDSEIAVLPSQLDFGLVTLGCLSQTLTATIYNTGIAEYSLQDVSLRGCGPEFEIVDRPALPAVVVPARPAPVSVRYAPQDLGPDTCELVLTSDAQNAGELTVPLRGEGTRFSEQTDEYVQTSGQEVDVLFVVDNSGSMDDEQANLADNMNRFTAAADLWDNDYQLGVVTTEIGGDAIFGGGNADPDRGNLVGDPRIVTPEIDRGRFDANVRVGSDGAGAQESGLEAARLALSPERLHEEGRGACDQCVDGEECVGGECVGYNRGFLRDDAALELVFLSDEEDQSPARVSFYIDFLKSIKGFRNEGLLHASAIVGPRGRACESNFGSAASGERYIDVVDATGGTFHSICIQDYGPALDAIGNRAFGLRVQFFLSRVPDPDTLVVSVEGAPRDAGWNYDEDSNSVIFDEQSVPQPGQHIEIQYTAFCFR